MGGTPDIREDFSRLVCERAAQGQEMLPVGLNIGIKTDRQSFRVNDDRGCHKYFPFYSVLKSPLSPLFQGGNVSYRQEFCLEAYDFTTSCDVGFPLCKGGQGDFSGACSRTRRKIFMTMAFIRRVTAGCKNLVKSVTISSTWPKIACTTNRVMPK
jgi:hypothetical protein